MVDLYSTGMLKVVSITLEADVHSKMSILKNVLQVCQTESTSDILDLKQSVPINRAATYTGVDTKIFPTLDRPVPQHSLEKPENTEGYYRDKYIYKTRYLIQKAMKILYLDKGILPTTDDITDELNYNQAFHKKPRPDATLLQPVRMDYMGYTWQKLTETKQKFLIEKPEYVNERFHYLTKISQYREEGRLLVFVDDSLVSKVRGLETCCLTAISPQLGLIKYKLYTKPNLAFEKWIIEDVMPVVPKESVVITDTPQDKVPDKPTKYSTKIEMVQWLERNGIPFRHDMHKVELYQLVKLHKSEELNACDVSLAANKLTLLRRPRWLPEFDLFLNFHELRTPTMSKEIWKMAGDTNLEMYVKMDKELEEREKSCLEEDKKLEDLLDTVLVMKE